MMETESTKAKEDGGNENVTSIFPYFTDLRSSHQYNFIPKYHLNISRSQVMAARGEWLIELFGRVLGIQTFFEL